MVREIRLESGLKNFLSLEFRFNNCLNLLRLIVDISLLISSAVEVVAASIQESYQHQIAPIS